MLRRLANMHLVPSPAGAQSTAIFETTMIAACWIKIKLQTELHQNLCSVALLNVSRRCLARPITTLKWEFFQCAALLPSLLGANYSSYTAWCSVGISYSRHAGVTFNMTKRRCDFEHKGKQTRDGCVRRGTCTSKRAVWCSQLS